MPHVTATWCASPSAYSCHGLVEMNHNLQSAAVSALCTFKLFNLFKPSCDSDSNVGQIYEQHHS